MYIYMCIYIYGPYILNRSCPAQTKKAAIRRWTSPGKKTALDL